MASRVLLGSGSRPDSTRFLEAPPTLLFTSPSPFIAAASMLVHVEECPRPGGESCVASSSFGDSGDFLLSFAGAANAPKVPERFSLAQALGISLSELGGGGAATARKLLSVDLQCRSNCMTLLTLLTHPFAAIMQLYWICPCCRVHWFGE